MSKRPFAIGIAGGTGSGKSTLAECLRQGLADCSVKVISTDAYFRQPLPRMTSPVSGRDYEDWNSPESLDCSLMQRAILSELECPQPVDVLIVEGLSVLYFPEIRNRLDLKVFVDLDSDERMYRRIRRNMEWGLKLEEIAGYFLESAKFMESRNFLPTKVFADVIVNGYMPDGVAKDMIIRWTRSRLER